LHPNLSNAGAKIDIPFKLPNILLKKVVKGVKGPLRDGFALSYFYDLERSPLSSGTGFL
jgi:hypothetical protein